MVLACNSEPPAYAELEDVCGGPSPFRVLELDPDEVVRGSETLRTQDRVLYVVSRLDMNDPDAPYSSTADSTVWATGPCGESPAQVASGIEDRFVLDVWPDVVLGCEKATGNVVVLDPTGAQEPHVVFSTAPHESYDCGLGWTDFGLVSLEKHDEEFGALVLHPYPTDPRTETATPMVVVDPIRIGPWTGGGPGFLTDRLYTFSDHALVLTPEANLMRVELGDAATSILQTEVHAFSITPSALVQDERRYLLWQDATVTKDDPVYPEGKIFLRDLTDGSDVPLGETSLRFSSLPLRWADRGLVQLSLGSLNDQKRIFFLPELNFVDVPGDLFIYAQLADGRWVGGLTWMKGNYLDVIDFPGGEPTRFWPREAKLIRHDDEAVELIETSKGDQRSEGPMWRVPLNGSAPTKLAERATLSMHHLDDGRLLGPVGVGGRWLASLVITDAETRAELRVDSRVHFYSMDTSRVNDERIVSYSVADGDRSGVYLAKLPTSE